MKKTVIITLALILFSSNSYSQRYSSRAQLNKPFLDQKPVHWGFTFGTSISNFVIYKNSDFFTPDSVNILGIESTSIPGFFLGPVINIRLSKYLDFRFLTNISFTQRNLKYYVSEGGSVITKEIKIPSSFVELPVLLKYKGERLNNIRPYVLLGGSAKFDLASNRKINTNTPYLKITPFDFYIELGPGFDFYFPYFKFSVELKYSGGFSNLIEIQNNPYSAPFELLRSSAFMLSFHFEG